MMDDVLKLGPRICAVPVVHGSGDFAWEVRRLFLSERFDCLAIPLPPSFQPLICEGIQRLPQLGVVYQRESMRNRASQEVPVVNYVPIDPCQPLIAAIRLAVEEQIPIRFIDLETLRFRQAGRHYPDPYGLKKVSLAQFAAALLPALRRPTRTREWRRLAHWAFELKSLCVDFRQIFFPCSMMDWVWLRVAYADGTRPATRHAPAAEPELAAVSADSAYFMLGELPFITGLYERARRTWESDANLAIDGVKELLLVARDAYRADLGQRGRKLTPQLLKLCLQYIRNLSLQEGYLTPQLVNIVLAAKQIGGDRFALHVLEQAKLYPYPPQEADDTVACGIGQWELPEGEQVAAVSRLPGPPKIWKSIELTPRPDESQREKWGLAWNPHGQCSWPPEDRVIEQFRASVFDRARQLMGQDLAKTEKFSASVKDGIDIRDTLRHWYEGSLYVKVLPPHRGRLDAVVMLFDAPADPRGYPWRCTWYAEHAAESTLAFFATAFADQPIGPGICAATYGGALLLFPPRAIPDIWTDPRFDFAETLEERLLAAACYHSRDKHVAVLAAAPPGLAWRGIAKHFRRQLVHVPLGHFSDQTVQQLRQVHVLNGRDVRSYAAQFIRKI